MNNNFYINLLKSSEYSFLKENEHLNNNIILLGLGGSHAYGTNVEDSDIDIRGIALNTKKEILLGQGFEQIVEKNTDTTIYSFNKIIKLLSNCNPNTIEILGLKPEQYLYLHPLGEELIKNKTLFLSKKAINSFGGYANSQLRRLDNKASRKISQTEQQQHILNSIKNASVDYKRKYFDFEDDQIHLYVDDAINDEYESEIFMDIHLHHYPLRDYKSMWSEMNNIVKEYAKNYGHRNKHAIMHNKLSKHMMHLVRLYLMCFDILEKGEINTYRDKDHDFLMSIRNGDYLDDNSQPTKEFFEIVDALENRLNYLESHTDLPDKPNYKAIQDFVLSVNERVIKGEV